MFEFQNVLNINDNSIQFLQEKIQNLVCVSSTDEESVFSEIRLET